ncbi:MAG: TonB-dependent receptor plug domain-containing protein, partial [Chitinophagaceae bacterium]
IRLAKQWELLVGVDYRHNTMRNDFNSMSVWGPFKSQFNDTAINQFSTYTSLLFKSGKWHVELGGRWNNHSKYGNNATFTFNPSYKVNDKYRLFGSISSGFKAPSLYQLYADINTGFPTGNPNLLPEKSLNYELGYQTSSPKFSDRMVFFYRTVTDGIDYNFVNFRYYNYVSQKVGGFEYEFTMPITSKWLVTGNYTYITARETAQNRQTTRDT